MLNLINYIRKSNLATTSILLCFATIISFVFYKIIPNDSTDIALTYILALILIARYTDGYRYGIIADVFAFFA